MTDVRHACVDANLVIRMLTVHPLQSRIDLMWTEWVVAGTSIVAPPLFSAEVTSVLRHHVTRGWITPEKGEEAFRSYQRLSIRIVSAPDLQSRAWELAKRYNRPRAYDAQYLAVAILVGCDFWTTDERLANGVGEPWINLVR